VIGTLPVKVRSIVFPGRASGYPANEDAGVTLGNELVKLGVNTPRNGRRRALMGHVHQPFGGLGDTSFIGRPYGRVREDGPYGRGGGAPPSGHGMDHVHPGGSNRA
jgi:hypothetical protein